MRIFKFGGASVKNAAAIRNLQNILADYAAEKLFVVVSALGKTTNELEEIASLGFSGEDYEEAYAALITRHEHISNELIGNVPETLRQLFRKLQDALKTSADSWEEYYDQVVSFGELMSTRLIHEFLNMKMNVQWYDARGFISTDSSYTKARVDWTQTGKNIHNHDFGQLSITQGFIGRSKEEKNTTLGREGSDYSAAIFAHFFQAKELVVWKDVPGVMTADPKLISDVQQYGSLSYRRAVELTYYGAKVIHPKTMAPLAKAGIPMHVRSFLDRSQSGTIISAEEPMEEILPTIVFRYRQTLISVRFPGEKPIDQLALSEVFKELDTLGIQINLMQNSALSFSFVFDHDEQQIKQLRESLRSKYAIYENNDLHLVTLMNYNDELQRSLPIMEEILLEQRTRHHYRILYAPEGS